MSAIPEVGQVLAAHGMDLDDEAVQALRAGLLEREDTIADLLRLTAANNGLIVEFVAEVIAEIGIGTPLSDEQRGLIRQQFINRMEQLRREHGGE